MRKRSEMERVKTREIHRYRVQVIYWDRGEDHRNDTIIFETDRPMTYQEIEREFRPILTRSGPFAGYDQLRMRVLGLVHLEGTPY